MADRFVLVPTRKWMDAWYRSLSPTERDCWDYVTQPHVETLTGIFEQSVADMAFLALVPVKKMEAALARFIAEGRLRRDENVFMAVKFFEVQNRGEQLKPLGRDGKKPDNRIKPITRELESFRLRAPELVAEWKLRYAPWMLSGQAPYQAPSAPGTEAPTKQEEEEHEQEEQVLPPNPPGGGEPAGAGDADSGRKPRTRSARLKASGHTLETLEAKIPEPCRFTWDSYKAALIGKRVNGMAESAIAGILLEFLQSCGTHRFSHGEFNAGLTGCMKARGKPPAEAETYFRACALDFRSKAGPADEQPEPRPAAAAHEPDSPEVVEARDAEARAEWVQRLRDRYAALGHEPPADLDAQAGRQLSDTDNALLALEIAAGVVDVRPGTMGAALAANLRVPQGPQRSAEEQIAEARRRGLLDEPVAAGQEEPDAAL